MAVSINPDSKILGVLDFLKEAGSGVHQNPWDNIRDKVGGLLYNTGGLLSNTGGLLYDTLVEPQDYGESITQQTGQTPRIASDLERLMPDQGSKQSMILPFGYNADGDIRPAVPRLARGMADVGLGLLGEYDKALSGVEGDIEINTDTGEISQYITDEAANVMGGLLDYFTGGAFTSAPKGALRSGFARSNKELYEDLPIIDPRDLIGAKIGHTPADLMRANTTYQGIDSAGTTRNTFLGGGPLFPLQKEYRDNDIAWLVDGLSTGKQKVNSPADFVAVTAMSPNAHRSNAAFGDAYMGTLEAYIKDGRIPQENMEALNNIIIEASRNTKDPELARLGNFVGFDSPYYDEYSKGLTFNQRAAIQKLMASPKAQNVGGPNVSKILDSTRENMFAGSNLGDTMMLLEIDKNKGVVDLVGEGLKEHPAYKYGVYGRPVGRFPNLVSKELMFPEKLKGILSNPNVYDDKTGGLLKSRVNYSFGRSRSPETITKEGAQNIIEGTAYNQIQPRQAWLINAAKDNQWKSSLIAKNKGGVGHTDYERALLRNPSLPSLEPYKAKDLKAGKKSGNFEVQQLGDSDIYFGLNRKPDYSWMNDGNAIPELGDNEVALVGVISNELGAKGVASPAVLGKAIEDGATVLDAFAVPSDKFPDGFLPKVYGDYGFEEIKRIPFSKDYYIEERGQTAYNDLLKQWKSEGWSEDKGFPDVILMKWSGTNEQRRNASKRVFEADFKGFGSEKTSGVVSEARTSSGRIANKTSGQKASGPDNGRGNTGQLRGDSGSRQPTGIRAVADEIDNLTPLQRKNLGLLN